MICFTNEHLFITVPLLGINSDPSSEEEKIVKKKKGDEPSRRMRLNSLGSFIYENMRTVYCPSKRVGCKCYGQIYRVQNGKVEGSPTALLLFAKLNPNTNRIYEHENHDAFPNTARVNSKYSAYTLSSDEKQYIIDRSQVG